MATFFMAAMPSRRFFRRWLLLLLQILLPIEPLFLARYPPENRPPYTEDATEDGGSEEKEEEYERTDVCGIMGCTECGEPGRLRPP